MSKEEVIKDCKEYYVVNNGESSTSSTTTEENDNSGEGKTSKLEEQPTNVQISMKHLRLFFNQVGLKKYGWNDDIAKTAAAAFTGLFMYRTNIDPEYAIVQTNPHIPVIPFKGINAWGSTRLEMFETLKDKSLEGQLQFVEEELIYQKFKEAYNLDILNGYMTDWTVLFKYLPRNVSVHNMVRSVIYYYEPLTYYKLGELNYGQLLGYFADPKKGKPQYDRVLANAITAYKSII